MIRCHLKATNRAPAAMDYTFYDAEGLKILTNRDEDMVDQFDLFLRELPIIPYTLSLIDADENERFSLIKRTRMTQSFPAFRLLYPKGSVDFFEDKARFSLPNISFEFEGRKVDITGSVRARRFALRDQGEVIATYEGHLIEGGKDYAIHIQGGALPLEVYLAAALVIDIYFHNY